MKYKQPRLTQPIQLENLIYKLMFPLQSCVREVSTHFWQRHLSARTMRGMLSVMHYGQFEHAHSSPRI